MQARTPTRELIHRAANGACLGALAGSLADTLGLLAVTGTAGLGITAAMAGGLLVSLWRGPTVLIWVDTLLLGAVAIIGLAPAPALQAQRWVRQDVMPSGVAFDAVVVLSGNVGSDTLLEPESADRLLSGLELIRSGAAMHLITTRIEVGAADRLLTTDADQRRLIALGAPGALWTIVGPIRSTRDEAIRTAELQKLGVRRIALVTSPIHTRRSCAAFEELGFRVTCVPALVRGYAARNPVRQGDRLHMFRRYLYERLATVEYRQRGWIR